MEKLPIIFARSNQIGSWLIRMFTWGRFSHVGIVDGDNVIEAVGFKGVVVTPLEEFKQRYSYTELAYFPCECLDQAYYLAYNEVGKKYDWLAIFGHIFRRRWDNPDRWVCSELIAYASQIVRHSRVSSYSPEDVFKNSSEIP